MPFQPKENSSSSKGLSNFVYQSNGPFSNEGVVEGHSYDSFMDYIRLRMKQANPKAFGHFADRRWVNQWSRIQHCGIKPPQMIGYFPADDKPKALQNLRNFVAPAGGALLKLNHQAGTVTALEEGAV